MVNKLFITYKCLGIFLVFTASTYYTISQKRHARWDTTPLYEK